MDDVLSSKELTAAESGIEGAGSSSFHEYARAVLKQSTDGKPNTTALFCDAPLKFLMCPSLASRNKMDAEHGFCESHRTFERFVALAKK